MSLLFIIKHFQGGTISYTVCNAPSTVVVPVSVGLSGTTIINRINDNMVFLCERRDAS